MMRYFQMTISATIEAEDEDHAWREWQLWLTNPRAVEDGTEVEDVTEELQ